jgi:hypothetical protein
MLPYPNFIRGTHGDANYYSIQIAAHPAVVYVSYSNVLAPLLLYRELGIDLRFHQMETVDDYCSTCHEFDPCGSLREHDPCPCFVAGLGVYHVALRIGS